MRSSVVIAALMVCSAVSPLALAADVVFGSFEGTTLGSGWRDHAYPSAHEYENSTKGATHGTSSLKIIPSIIDFTQTLDFKLQELPSPLREEAFEGFINNTHIAFDVTWDNSEWIHQGGDGWNGARMFITYNEEGSGFNDPPIGINPDSFGFTQPNIDTGNPTNQGFWDKDNYPGVHTRTMMFDYTTQLAELTSNATDGWIEFWINIVPGTFNWPAPIYVDNFRFTTPTVDEPLSGDFNDDGTVDAADYTIWRDNFGEGDDSVLNGNGDEVAGVGAGDYDLWKTNFGGIGGGPGGGGVAAGGVPEPGTMALAAFSLGLMGLLRRRA